MISLLLSQCLKILYNHETSSTIGPCRIMFLSIFLLGTLKATLALIICVSKYSLLSYVYLGVGCTTGREHHVTKSPG